MQLGRYQLLTPLGAGVDGVAYRAETGGEGRPLEHVQLRILSGAAADADRWDLLTKRLRVASFLQHPNALAVRERNLDEKPPYVALAWPEPGTLAEQVRDDGIPDVTTVLRLAQQLASLLAAAHRLGLAHVDLCPTTVLGSVARPLLDFTGLEVSTAPIPDPFAELNASCRAPEETQRSTPRLSLASPPGNLYSLGALLFWLLTRRRLGPSISDTLRTALLAGPNIPAPLQHLTHDLLNPVPELRPPAREVLQRLTALLASARPPGSLGAGAPTAPASLGSTQTVYLTPGTEDDRTQLPPQLGRYRLLEKLGQGGMGTVYKAEDMTDGSVVALKVLRPDWAANPDHLRRFHKEARLLAEVNNPHVTNLLGVNEDDGIHYLAMEFVAGENLEQRMREHGRMEEPQALALVADVARGLATAHAAGIVHRDIKPENILLEKSEVRSQKAGAASTDLSPLTSEFCVKLTDFGLARHVIESESLNVTRAGAVLGTPLYMAPEQCGGEAVDARADVYALGATLYHLLAGRPPFEASSALALVAMHRNDPLPPLQKFNPAVSDGACRVITKAMAKRPESRYSDAAALLADLERLLRGEPSSIAVHPRLPPCDPARVLAYDFSWELESPPARLWPHVSNTERLNRALGMTPPEFTMVPEGGEVVGWMGGSEATQPHPTTQPPHQPTTSKGVRRFGRFHKAVLSFAWEEHPFEWIEARRMGVLREYSEGPFKWLISIVELEPRTDGGTTLFHRLRLEPRTFLGKTLAAVEINIRTRRSLEKVYRRIDRALIAQAHGPVGTAPYVDPFEEPFALPKARRRRLEALLEELEQQGLDPTAVERLGDFLATAPPQEVARIRPLALARRLGVDPDCLIAVCLYGARRGLLILLWDIICPLCRIPSEVKDTLQALREHGRCEVCQLDFALDFANSVEMIFRAHPEVRESDLATYCVGGPAHSPHVVAQARISPGERIELDVMLSEGAYRLRGPQLPFTLDFRVDPSARAARWDLVLSQSPGLDLPRVLSTGGQLFALTNDGDQELLVRLERAAQRADALTAARASSLALFRELFPGEALSPGQLISVTTLTFLVTDLVAATQLYRDLGDARAFILIHEYFRLTQESVVNEGGALVKTVGEGMLAVFSDPAAAVRVAAGLPALLANNETTRPLGVRVAAHRGAALAATLNDHLDYFGATLNQARQLPALAASGEMVLSQVVAADPGVAALLQAKGLTGTVAEGGATGLVLHRFVLPTTP
jgi:serine/threonine protein kinase/class 3 adenylate cyclase